MRKKPPREGAVFLVPLRDHGYAIGVLARASGEGHCFGYFFGPRIQGKAEVDFRALTPKNAVLVGKFGDLELLRKNWELIGTVPNWTRSEWPMVPMARRDAEAGRAWLSIYDDAFNCLEETEISVDDSMKYPYDRMMGAGSVEIRLTKLLSRA